jgi:Holliday junction resolvase
MTQVNLKSDVAAKLAFVEVLLREGFEDARVTCSPADITALRDGEVNYFEIKYTAQAYQYFGAATLTEWEAALNHESRFWFVIASKQGSSWFFQRYTPEEFMNFCSIPPFKIFFHVGMETTGARKKGRPTKKVLVSRERIAELVELYRRFRSERVDGTTR